MFKFILQFLTPFSANQTSNFLNIISLFLFLFWVCTILLGHFPVKAIICEKGSQNSTIWHTALHLCQSTIAFKGDAVFLSQPRGGYTLFFL